MALSLSYVAHSEIGPVRKNNQDSAYASGTLLMVADGMGGAAAGDLASAVVVRTFKEIDDNLFRDANMIKLLANAIELANDHIAQLVDADPELEGMGSTFCGALFDGEQLAIANVGDSRAYLYRDGQLTRLTHDHSWVQTLVDEGRLTEEESLIHPHRSLILRVINGGSQHQPDLSYLPVEEGDRLVFCSDGLSGLVLDDAVMMRMEGTLAEVRDNLVDLAYSAGGSDNITVIVADVVERELDAAPPERLILGAAALINLDEPISEITAKLPDIVADIQAQIGSRPAVRSVKATIAADTTAVVAAPAAAAGEADDAGDEEEVEPSSPEEERYAPTSKRRPMTLLKVFLTIVLPLALLATAGVVWYNYTQQQYYIGVSGEYVAIYQGIPDPVFNLPLNHVVVQDTTKVADLPAFYREKVEDTYPVKSVEDGQTSLVELRNQYYECVNNRARGQEC
ncbi:MAG: protein phosphatase 2C domain-containing protein [Propionibacteriaceae bacterium]|jgi:protein phosphatase|nr:protein phosphatase 2C domain-containing protein [Propionibacteriaceae bacterium]